MSPINAHWRGQARMIEESVAAWQRDHAEALTLCELEDVLSLAVEVGRHLNRVIAESFERLFAGKVAEVQRLGELRLQACELMIAPLQSLLGVLVDAQSKGYNLAPANQVQPTIDALVKSRDRLLTHWPRLDEEELRRGFAQADRGELIDAEEAFRELESASHP